MTKTADILSADDAGTIEQGARILREGGLVAFPTETVYGLGADACNPLAVARIFEVKRRPRMALGYWVSDYIRKGWKGGHFRS